MTDVNVPAGSGAQPAATVVTGSPNDATGQNVVQPPVPDELIQPSNPAPDADHEVLAQPIIEPPAPAPAVEEVPAEVPVEEARPVFWQGIVVVGSLTTIGTFTTADEAAAWANELVAEKGGVADVAQVLG